MLGPDDAVTRRLSCGDAAKLLQCSPLAMRAFLALFWGEDSERAGLSRCRPGAMAEVLGSSRRAVVSALDELQSIGLIKWSADEGLAIRDGFALANWPKDWPNSRAWANTIMRLRDGLIVSELRESLRSQLQAASQATSKAASEATSQATSEAIVRQSVSPSVRQSNSTPLPLVAAPTGATAGKVKAASAQLDLGDRTPAVSEPKPVKKATLAQKPPTADETKAIFTALGCPEERLHVAENCLDYWISNGFKRKNGPILDWPATCRTWWRNELDRNGSGSRPAPRNGPGPGMMRTPGGWMPEPERKPIEDEILY